MWANSAFSLEENRVFATPAANFPSFNYKSSSAGNYWKTWAPAATSATSFGPSYHQPSGNGGYALPERRPPPPPASALILNSKAVTATHRVIAFHSSASWRAYFQASKATNKLIVIDFTATWCGPCRKMEPAIDEFAAMYTDVDFAKIDVDALYDVSCEYGVQTMPTFLLMKNGKVIDKVTGARKEELQRKIEKYRV